MKTKFQGLEQPHFLINSIQKLSSVKNQGFDEKELLFRLLCQYKLNIMKLARCYKQRCKNNIRK